MPTSRNQPSDFTLRNARLFAFFIKAPRWNLWRASFCITATAAGFVTVPSSAAVAQQFQDVTREVGLVLKAKHSWGNPIWGDINNDGFVDLIVPTHGLLKSHGPFVYLNNGGKTFTDIRATCGITRHVPLDAPDWHGFSFGDYDGDGNLDLYISIGATEGTLEKSDLLFRGRGDGTFENVTHSAGIETSTNRGRCGFWVDYDNDGRLDLFVKNFEGANRLYRNHGGGPFQNTLYRNNGDGTFTDLTAEAGVVGGPNNWAAVWGDYDNDGFLDLFVTNPGIDAEGVGNANLLYHNNGDGTFTDRATEDGLALQDDNPLHLHKVAAWADYNNDGFLDMIVKDGLGSERVGDVAANGCHRLFNESFVLTMLLPTQYSLGRQ